MKIILQEYKRELFRPISLAMFDFLLTFVLYLLVVG